MKNFGTRLSNPTTPNRQNSPVRRAASLLEIMICLGIMILGATGLFNLQKGSEKSIIKAGEFMVAGAVLHNISELYKIRPFEEIVRTVYHFDESGAEALPGKAAFQIKVDVETVVMPNNWAAYKRIFLDVEKRGTFFGTTLLKTALLRTTWLRDQ